MYHKAKQMMIILLLITGIQSYSFGIDCTQAYNAQKFVKRFYKEILGRTADSGGLNYWTSKLIRQELSASDIANGFINSYEFQHRRVTNPEYVTLMYRAILGREPDPGGFNFWRRWLDQGHSRNDIVRGFVYSAEFASLARSYGLSVSQRVRRSPGASLSVNAGANITVGYGTQVIRDASASGSISCYWWQEGDTKLSDSKRLSKGDFAQGTHNLTVTAVNTDGVSATSGMRLTVTAPNNSPIIDFAKANAPYVAKQQNIYFSSSARDSDGWIASYTWKEGNTLISNSRNFNKVLTPGVHTLTLTVKDNRGATASKNVSITVLEGNVQIMNYVTRFYVNVLDRQPDILIQGWVNSLANHSQNAGEVARGFIESTEFTEKHVSNAQFVTILYKAFFNRDSDTGGYNHWLNKLNSGTSRKFVLNGFIYAGEFVNLAHSAGVIPNDGRTGPAITLNGVNTITLYRYDAYSDAGATAREYRGGTLPVHTEGSVNTSVPGVYHIVYSAIDSIGLESSAMRTVTIRSDERPVSISVQNTLSNVTQDHITLRVNAGSALKVVAVNLTHKNAYGYAVPFSGYKESGIFKHYNIPLIKGDNQIEIKATARNGSVVTKTITIHTSTSDFTPVSLLSYDFKNDIQDALPWQVADMFIDAYLDDRGEKVIELVEGNNKILSMLYANVNATRFLKNIYSNTDKNSISGETHPMGDASVTFNYTDNGQTHQGGFELLPVTTTIPTDSIWFIHMLY